MSGDRPVFPTSDSPFPEGKGRWSAALFLEEAPRPAQVCRTLLRLVEVCELTWTSAPRSCPSTTTSLWDLLWNGAAFSFCGSRLRYPSSLWRGSVWSVLGCVSLLFPCPWVHILWLSFPGSLHSLPWLTPLSIAAAPLGPQKPHVGLKLGTRPSSY